MCPEGLSAEWGWITTTSPFVGIKMSEFSTVSRWKPRRSSTGPQSFAWPGCLPFVGAPTAARARRTYLAHIPWLYLFALFRRCVVYFSISTGISMPARLCAAPDSSDKDGRREIGELVKQRAMPIYGTCHTYSKVRWKTGFSAGTSITMLAFRKTGRRVAAIQCDWGTLATICDKFLPFPSHICLKTSRIC